MSVVRRATEAETTHTHTHTPPLCVGGQCSHRLGADQLSAAILPPPCRRAAATMWSAMWSASMPSPCLTLLYGGHVGMKWDATVVAGVWRAYLGA